MGVYLHYQALPAESVLLRRLETEVAFYSVYVCMLHHPSGPFHGLHLEDSEMNDLLTRLLSTGVFASESLAQNAVVDFTAQFTRSQAEDPDLAFRAVYVKLTEELEGYAVSLSTVEHPRLGEFLHWGAQSVQPGYPGDIDGGLSLVPPDLVSSVSPLLPLLRKNNAARHDLGDSLLSWQEFYRLAAGRSDAVVLG